MEEITLGEITVTIQNEVERNEDIYAINGFHFKDICDNNEVMKLLTDHLEDPERFFINKEESGFNVYTKQPDAVIELAIFLNAHKDMTVSEKEISNVRELLIRMQS